MKKLIYILILLMVGGVLLWQFKSSIIPSFSVQPLNPYVIINNHIIKVEIADDFNKQRLGLSNRENLGENVGMLFIFPNKQIRRFWMKNMNFALDIIWLDYDLSAQAGKIIRIDKNLLPERDNPKKEYSSVVPINYVLEVNAGLVNKYNIQVGDEVKFNL